MLIQEGPPAVNKIPCKEAVSAEAPCLEFQCGGEVGMLLVYRLIALPWTSSNLSEHPSLAHTCV